MRIAVLSGKGGVGKTLVAVNLAAVASDAVYADCDVEEPNGHIFLMPQWQQQIIVNSKVPVVDHELCVQCRQCVSFCRFHALAMVAGQVLVFDELCHSCGGCSLVCPVGAISESNRMIGKVYIGHSGSVVVVSGALNPGEHAATPVIREVIEYFPKAGTIMIDCPPGSSCSVMESVQVADYCLLVAEPTIFGRDNLAMVDELVKLMKKPAAVILNKTNPGRNPSEDYAREKQLPIVARIPFDRELAASQAQGHTAVWTMPLYRQVFQDLLAAVLEEATHAENPGLKR